MMSPVRDVKLLQWNFDSDKWNIIDLILMYNVCKNVDFFFIIWLFMFSIYTAGTFLFNYAHAF